MTTKNKNIAGFTLIEVMIALVIVSISLMALSATMGQYVFNQSAIQNRVIATWVAQNRLLELQTATNTTQEKTQTENMLGADWQTTFVLEPTLIPGLKKINISAGIVGAKYTSAEVVSIVGN